MSRGGKDCLCGGTGEIDDYRPGKPYPCPECQAGPFPASVNARMAAENMSYKVRGGNCAVVLLALLTASGTLGWWVLDLLFA